MKKLYLHTVIVKKPAVLRDAMNKAKEIMNRKEEKDPFFRETEDSYRFRNIPKTRFDKKSFRTKVIDETTSIVFGHLLES